MDREAMETEEKKIASVHLRQVSDSDELVSELNTFLDNDILAQRYILTMYLFEAVLPCSLTEIASVSVLV